uniref:Uncharacterized protein n=1 Tax=Electrophorus electricus TaxID=8005 RepID=A0A4W4F0X9_ELEEL
MGNTSTNLSKTLIFMLTSNRKDLQVGNPNNRNVRDKTLQHVLCMGPHIVMGEGDMHHCDDCLRMMQWWTGTRLEQSDYKSADVNANDSSKSTLLHYAAMADMKSCVEVKTKADLFVENEDHLTLCDCTERQHYKELALSLESQTVRIAYNTSPPPFLFLFIHPSIHPSIHSFLEKPQKHLFWDLWHMKNMLIMETTDMLQTPLFWAEAPACSWYGFCYLRDGFFQCWLYIPNSLNT